MSRRSLPRAARRGFSLIEALISIVILVIVMVATLSMLYGMQAFAQKQQTHTFPRQNARAAIDYLSYYVEGAGDLNIYQNNPNALLMYYTADAQNLLTPQIPASYNNLNGTEVGNSITVPGRTTAFGDLGTDIITVSIPTRPIISDIIKWPGYKHGATMWVNYRAGCPDSQMNMWKFQAATNATPLPAAPNTSNQAQSGMLMLTDPATGAWVYFQITGYQQSDCTVTNDQVIHITANPGQSGMIDPPCGHPELVNPKIIAGVDYKSFRVRNGSLEQKNGMFNPTTDNPGNAFFPVVENIEDFQVGYIYGLGPHLGQVWNTGYLDPGLTWQTSTITDLRGRHIPSQAGPCQTASPGCPNPAAPDEWDVTNVIGLRISLTGRSLPMPLSGMKLSRLKAKNIDPMVAHYFRPASEDHPEGSLDYVAGPNPLVYDHVRLTTTLMLRNRILGN